MSSQNPNPEAETKAKDPVFEQASDKAHAGLEKLENQFVSLSSQRQLNFILGSLMLIAAFSGPLGVLISLVLGTLMIVQAATGNMIINNFLTR